MVDSARERLTGAFVIAKGRPLTTLALVAGVIVFLLLLGGNAGAAVLVSLLVVPAAILFYLTRLALYEREPWPLLAGVVGAGALVGLLGGLLATFVFERFWFSDSRLNVGAIGFAGISANGEGSVPISVLLLGGILITVLTGAAILGGPIVLRRWPIFRNEITDGMTLGGLAAAGFVTVSSFVYFWPGAFNDLPDRPVSQWTAILAGIVVVRPIVLILAGSLLGIAAGQYLSTKDIRTVLVPGVAGAFGWLALPLGSLLLTQSGAVTEFVWYAIVLIVVGVLFRHALRQSLATDQQVLAPADGERRVVCPNCHRVTPDGSYCSFCRAPLHPEAPVALVAAAQADPITADQAEQPTIEPSNVGSDSSSRSAPAHVPVMATGDSTSDDSDHRERASESASPAQRDWLDEVAAEPEADALDNLGQAPINADSTSTVRTGSSSTPNPPYSSSPTPEAASSTSPAPSKFQRPDAEHQPPLVAAEADIPDIDPAADARADVDLSRSGQDDEQNPPISLQDWSHRSDPQLATAGADVDEPGDADVSPSSNRPVPSPWKRGADPAAAPTSGLKWPTSTAPSIDQSVAPAQLAPEPPDDFNVGDAQEASLDGDGPAVRQEQAPVASSSGRWFDASSTLGDSTSNTAGPNTSAEQSNDVVDALRDDVNRVTVGETPPVGQPGQPAEPLIEAASTHESIPPSGLQWYRQDDETGQSVDDEPGPSDAAQFDGETESPHYSSDAVTGSPSSSEQPPQETGAGGSSDAEVRTGIWRSITRHGRGGAPRAPHRDREGSDGPQ